MLKRKVPTDIVRVADRRLEIRYVGPINGCYVLSDRRGMTKGDVEVYACRTQSISPSAVAITAPVIGADGERVTARLDGLGILRGRIERQTSDGFVFLVECSDANRAKLAAQIDWVKKKSLRKHDDKRSFKRFQPRDPRSTIALPDGSIAKCFVIDMSRSGAAVSAYARPELGARVVLGTLASHVIRHLDVGFAVEFDAAQDAEGLESLTTGFAPIGDIAPDVWPVHASLKIERAADLVE